MPDVDHMSVRSRLLVVVGVCLLLASMVGLAGDVHAASDDGDRDRTDVASIDEVRSAKRPLERELGGNSAREPDQCKDIDAPVTAPNNGERAEGGTAVSPATLELVNVVPGQTYRGCITVTNYDDTPLRGFITDLDITASNELDASVQLETNSTGVGTWIVPSERAFSLAPKSSRSIPYVIRVPNPIPAGTVVGGIAAELEPEGGIRTSITQRVYSSSPGGSRGKLDISDVSADRIVMSDEAGTYRARMTVKNQSDYLESFNATVKLRAFGRTVKTTKVKGAALLPMAGMRIVIAEKDLPWIGVFRPTAYIEARNGTLEQPLPLLIVVPPLPFSIALLAAVLLPAMYLLHRWRRRRQEWMAYLMEEMDREERGEGFEDAEDYWDPMRQP